MQRKSILKDTIQLTVVQFFSGMGKFIAERLAHAPHWCCNRRDCRIDRLFFFSWLRSLRMATAFSAPAALYRRSWESPTATLTVF